MNRLNYFNPYLSKGIEHEDQLTRAFLVMLKHSSHAFIFFIDYCRSKQLVSKNEQAISILEFLEHGWEIETQKGNPIIDTDYLLSVLITDTQLAQNEIKVESSDRNARYDGIITAGKHLTMVIENKPRSANVWFEQLNPSRQNLEDDTQVFAHPVILEWKDLIKQLKLLISTKIIAYAERVIIDDFISFVDENFPFLNPYDRFDQCNGNFELLDRRINNLLKTIACNEDDVMYHKGWGYYIQTPFEQIQEIGLILEKHGSDWSVDLSMYFGATQRQAKAFYNSNPNIALLKNTGWQIFPNFHVSFRSTNLVWFPSADTEFYIDFWKRNIDLIFQQKRTDVQKYLNKLIEQKVIEFPMEVEEDMNNKFWKTKLPSLNICPEIGLKYSYKSKGAIEMDRGGKLKYDLVSKIHEGLKVMGLSGDGIVRRF